VIARQEQLIEGDGDFKAPAYTTFFRRPLN
jgi:hypothetical protein